MVLSRARLQQSAGVTTRMANSGREQTGTFRAGEIPERTPQSSAALSTSLGFRHHGRPQGWLGILNAVKPAITAAAVEPVAAATPTSASPSITRSPIAAGMILSLVMLRACRNKRHGWSLPTPPLTEPDRPIAKKTGRYRDIARLFPR